MEDQKELATDPVSIKRLRELAFSLQSYGVKTLEDLRLSICKDHDTGITTVAERTKTSKALLVALLITEARDDSGNKGTRQLVHYWSAFKTFRSVFSDSRSEIRELLKTKHWRETREPINILLRHSFARPRRVLTNWRTHWLDALVVLVPLTLGLLLIVRVNSINKNSRQFVTTTTSVPAFQKISNEVEIKSSTGAKSGFTTIDEVRDRYTLANVPAGAALQSNQLMSPLLSQKMQSRKILLVPIRAGNYSPTLTAPEEAILVLSPRTMDSKATSPMTFEVIVLRIDGSGETRSAVVALKEDRFDTAALLLGSHEAFLSPPVR